MTSNVLNRVEQPAMGSNDNPIIIEGTSQLGISNFELRNQLVDFIHPDISTATIKAFYVPAFKCQIVGGWGVLMATPGAATVLTFYVGTAVESIVNIGGGDTVGTKFIIPGSSTTIFTPADTIEISTDGGATTTPTPFMIQLKLKIV